MIEYLNLCKVTARYESELEEAVRRVAGSGRYLLGEEVKAFENEYARYIGTRSCVGCGNGLDALSLIFRAYRELGQMNDGDQVIVPANTFIASIMAVTENNLVPVLAEPGPDTLELDGDRLESLITPRTRAVLLVHLYGRNACTRQILEICKKYNLKLIEDNAQAQGCMFEGRRTGSLGDAAGHSFYPGKNLGAFGDAGAVTTDNEELAGTVRILANYGSEQKYVFKYCGRNSRLDEMNAAVLRVKLAHLDEDNEIRKRIAHSYIDGIRNSIIRLPVTLPSESNVFHIFPVFCEYRDRLKNYLQNAGVQTLIHYPVPPHRQECYKSMNGINLPVTEKIHREELSLPLNPAMTDNEAEYIIGLLNSFNC